MISTSIHRTGFFCLCLLLFLFQMVEWAYIPNTIAHIFFLSVSLSVVIKSKTYGFNLFSVFGLVFLVYAMASLFWSEVPSSGGHILLTYVIPSVLLIACGANDGEKIVDFSIFYKFIVIVASILSIYAIYQYAMGLGYYDGMANYPFFNPNSLAIFLGIGGVIAYYNYIENRQILYVIGLSAIAIGIITTQSQAVIIIFPIVVLFLMVFHARAVDFDWSKIKIPFFTLFGLVIGLSFIPILLDMVFSKNIDVAMLLDFSKTKFSSRLTIWDSAVNASLATHPIIGSGIGTFKHIYSEFRQVGDFTMGMHAHNDILHLWLEMGLFGIVFILVLLFAILKSMWMVWRDKRQDKILPLSIVVFMFCMSLVSSIILLPAFMLILGLALCDLFPLLKLKIINSGLYAQFVSLIFILLIGFTFITGTQYFYIYNVHKSLSEQNIESFFESIDKLDAVSLRLNPTVPLMRISLLFTLYDKNLIDNGQRADALLELEGYIKDAVRRNPFNADNIFYHGELENRRGNTNKAGDLYKKALSRDPMHINARLALVKMNDDIDEKLTLLRDGFNYRYWRSNPMKMYAMAMAMAKQYGDEQLLFVSEKALQHQMRLK